MLVAVCDQSTGTSTSRCSKITEPLSFPIEAVRSSHGISSYGVLPGSSLDVKYRGNAIPVFVLVVVLGSNVSIFAIPTASCPIDFSSSFPLHKLERLRNVAPICSVTSRNISICCTLQLRERGVQTHKQTRWITTGFLWKSALQFRYAIFAATRSG